MRLALRYAVLGSRPLVILVGGRIGSGKSTVARRIAHLLGLAWVSGDTERKSAAGLPLYTRTDPEKQTWLYSPGKSRENYHRLLDLALLRVRQSQGVVIDATFGKKEYRAIFLRALESQQVPYCFVQAQASGEVIRARLQARETNPEVISDARLEDFAKLSREYEETAEIPAGHLLRVNTERPLGETTLGLLRELSRLPGR